MAKLLLSADVILEAILNRTPLVESAEIWFKNKFIERSVNEEVVEVYLPEISRDIIHFILSSKNEQTAKGYVSFVLSEYKVSLTTDIDDIIENKVSKNIYQEKNNIILRRILTSYEKEYAKKNGYYYVTLEPLYPYVTKDVSRVITPQMLADSLAIVEALCDDMSNNAASQAPQALRVIEKTKLRTQRRETLRQILDQKLNDKLNTIVPFNTHDQNNHHHKTLAFLTNQLKVLDEDEINVRRQPEQDPNQGNKTEQKIQGTTHNSGTNQNQRTKNRNQHYWIELAYKEQQR